MIAFASPVDRSRHKTIASSLRGCMLDPGREQASTWTQVFTLVMLLLAQKAVLADQDTLIVVVNSTELQAVEAGITASGCLPKVAPELPSNILLAQACPQPADAVQASIAALPGVRSVEPNQQRQIWAEPLSEGAAAAPPRPRTEDGVAAAAAGAACSPRRSHPDLPLDLGVETEPYSHTMLQANHPEVRSIAQSDKSNNVFFCLIDAGIDRANQETSERASGCRPNVVSRQRAAFDGLESRNFERQCIHWDSDQHPAGHGTQVSSILGANANGKGTIGVFANAQIYMYKIQRGMTFNVTEELTALEDCLDEFDSRKRSIPELRMVVSMSYTYNSITWSVKDFITETAARGDVLFFAGAGNDGRSLVRYPAGYPGVNAVSSVDWNFRPSPTSNSGDHIAFTAPGVEILAALPLKLTPMSSVYLSQGFEALTTQPALPDVAADPTFFQQPPVAVLAGSGLAAVTAPLMDCGLGQTACSGATGRICLIKRSGGSSFCAKVLSCTAGGGVGVILYNDDSFSECDPFGDSASLLAGNCNTTDKYPLVLGVSWRQGSALASALAAAIAAGTELAATLKLPPVQDGIGLSLASGTSMACPAAAGVAGLVWAAWPRCTSQEILAALQSTALKPFDDLSTTPAGSPVIETGGEGPPLPSKDPRIGYGMPQAFTAKQQLERNPCEAYKSQPIVSLRVTPGGAVCLSGNLTVRANLTVEATGAPMPQVTVQLTSADGMLVCARRAAPAGSRAEVTTNARGVAVFRCTAAKTGGAVISVDFLGSRQFKKAGAEWRAVIKAPEGGASGTPGAGC